MLKSKFFIFISIILGLFLNPLSFAQESENCLNQLKDLLQRNPDHPALQEVLKLQGKLTIQRLTWSLANNVQGSAKFTVEKAIDSILENIDTKTQEDPKFKEAYDIYSGHKLTPQNKSSRNGLLAILPHIQDILNSQVNVTDPIERKKYIIQKSDITLLSILAEKETRNDEGLFDHILKSDRSSERSILNFTKIINSTLRNKEVNQNLLDNIKSQIPKVEKDLKSKIAGLPLDAPCVNYLSGNASCVEKPKEDDIPLITFLKDFDEFDKTQNLKYGDIWLDTRKASPIVHPPAPLGPATSPQILPEELEIEVSTADIPEDFLKELAYKVLDRYPYFLPEEELLKDPELLFAINHALDNYLDYFIYKGENSTPHKYQLPNAYNELSKDDIASFARDRKNQRKFKKNKHLKKYGELIPENFSEKEKEEFLNYLITFNSSKHKQDAFEFYGKIYNSKTGKVLERSKEALLSFKDLGETNEELAIDHFKALATEQKDLAYQAAKDSKKTYIYNNTIYFLGSSPVDINKEMEKKLKLDPLEHERKVYQALVNQGISPSGQERLQIQQALLEEDNAIVIGKEVISPKTLSPYTSKEQEAAISLFLKSNPSMNSNFESLSEQRKKDWFTAMKNNQVTYNSGDKTFYLFDNSEVTTPYHTDQNNKTNWTQRNDYIQALNRKEDKDTIIGYHQSFKDSNQCDFYTIVDKKKTELTVYNNTGEILFQTEVLIGQKPSDQRLKYYTYNTEEKRTNLSTTAGIFRNFEFRTSHDANYYGNYGSCLMALENEDGTGFGAKVTKNGRVETVMAMHQTPVSLNYRKNFYANGDLADNRATNGCINLREADCANYKQKFQETNCPFYVLPEEKDINGKPKFEMKVVENQLVFKPTDSKFCKNDPEKCYKDYSISPRPQSEIKDIDIKISNPQHASNPIVQEFIATLESEKKNLSEKLNLTNDEYNNLASLAYAILGVESGFGKENRYLIKEGRNRLTASLGEESKLGKLGRKVDESFLGDMNQWLGQRIVDVLKTKEENDSENSRGLTQIKNVTDYTKDIDPSITEDNLTNPRNAAIATMAILKNISTQMDNADDNHFNIRPENRLEFMYYFYNGANSQVTNGAGAIELSLRAKEIKQNLDEVHIYEAQ